MLGKEKRAKLEHKNSTARVGPGHYNNINDNIAENKAQARGWTMRPRQHSVDLNAMNPGPTDYSPNRNDRSITQVFILHFYIQKSSSLFIIDCSW